MNWKCKECGSVNEGGDAFCTCGYDRTNILPRKGRFMRSLLWTAEFISLFGLLVCLQGRTGSGFGPNGTSEARELWLWLAGNSNLGEEVFAIAAAVFAVVLYQTEEKRHGH